MDLKAARSVAGRDLPECPPEHRNALSLVLFYQVHT
jgi:hypothetical protein